MYEEILDYQPYGIAKFTKFGAYIYFNQQELTLRQLTKSDMDNLSIFTLYNEKEKKSLETLFELLLSGEKKEELFRYQQNDKFFQMRLIKDSNENIVSTLTDITEEQNMKKLLLQNENNIKQLNDAIKGSNIGIWDFFPQEGRIVANETWVTQKKYKSEDFRAKEELFSDVIDGLNKWASIVHPDDLEPTSKLIEKHLNGETEYYDAKFRMMCGDGKWRWIHDLGQVFQRDEEGNAIRMNGVHIDITNMKEIEFKLDSLSTLDYLTNVFNRKHYNTKISELLSLNKRYHTSFSILMYDIDNFKDVNDKYGHHVGDNVLIDMCKLVKSLLRDSDLLFRVGGEEFIILLPETNLKESEVVAEKIRKNVEQLITVKNNPITISIGLTEVTKHDTEDLIYQRVDKLLYVSKYNGKNKVTSVL